MEGGLQKYYISVDYKNKSFAFAVITERGISTGETSIHPTILNRFTTGGKQPIIRGRGIETDVRGTEHLIEFRA